MRHLKLKHLILAAALAVAVWAFWPARAGSEGASPLAKRISRNPNARHVLRIAPDLYMPGTIPQDVGKPLEGMNAVAEAFEKLYPDTAIQFVQVPTGQREWLVTQLASGTAPDIFQVNVEDIWQDVQKGWYIPLDRWLEQPNPFVPDGQPGSRQWWDLFKYHAITRGKAAPDGNMYCISFDMVETGIFYNKDLFRRYGLTEPEDWDQFIHIQETLKKHGIVPSLINAGAMSDWGVDLMFDQLYYSIHELTDLRTDPKRAAYLANYLDWDEIAYLRRKGFFTEQDPRWVDLWRILKDCRQYMPREITSKDVLRSFITQEGAMFWDGSWSVNKLARDPDVTFDWGVFYVPRLTKNQSRFASGLEQCVIGGSALQYSLSNSSIKDTPPGMPIEARIEQSERLKRCIAFLQFLTLPRNADRVTNEVLCFLPNIVGVEPHRELLPFDRFLQRRYASTKWTYTFDLRFTDIQNRMLNLYLNGGIDDREFIQWMVRNVDAGCETITRRKNIDLDQFDRIWAERLPLRQSLPGLPAGAR